MFCSCKTVLHNFTFKIKQNKDKQSKIINDVKSILSKLKLGSYSSKQKHVNQSVILYQTF